MTNHSVASFNVKPTSEWMLWVIANQDWRLMSLTGKERPELLFWKWSCESKGEWRILDALARFNKYPKFTMYLYDDRNTPFSSHTNRNDQNYRQTGFDRIMAKVTCCCFRIKHSMWLFSFNFSLQLFNISLQLPNFGINPWLAFQTRPQDHVPKPTATWSTQMLTVWDTETVGWCCF